MNYLCNWVMTIFKSSGSTPSKQTKDITQRLIESGICQGSRNTVSLCPNTVVVFVGRVQPAEDRYSSTY